MKIQELWHRASGKSPSYLLKRGLCELGRQIGVRMLLSRLRSHTAADVVGKTGFSSLSDMWRASPAVGVLPNRAQRPLLIQLMQSHYPQKLARLKASCQRILDHEFDLLGSGPTKLGQQIDWHLDFKSGRRWHPRVLSLNLDCLELELPSDVKVPWELSRCQHLVTLGRGWVVFHDRRYAEEFQVQVRSWIRLNPVGRGVNWACTMEVALRAVNWIWALSLFEDAELDPSFLEEILLSLYQHGRWIPENLEIGPVKGNHYLSNLVGMLACGLLFSAISEGQDWLSKGAALLEEESKGQIGADGVDIEGSVPYHCLVLELFLVGRHLCLLGTQPVSSNFDESLRGMFEFVHACTTPAGSLPIVGDADDGRVLILGGHDHYDPLSLLSTGTVLFRDGKWKQRVENCWPDTLWLLGPQAKSIFEKIPCVDDCQSQHFGSSGFHVLRTKRQYLFVDAGPVGYCGMGGHGHNDCLSFEWHVDGRPILTDSGSFVYTASPEWRNKFRSTSYHNTIRIDGQEMNRFTSDLSLWTLRDDAQPFGVEWASSQEFERLCASHSGYQRLKFPVQVSRQFELSHLSDQLILRDSIEGLGKHTIEFFFHASPGAAARRLREGVALQWTGQTAFRLEIMGESAQQLDWRPAAGWHSPSYGVRVERPVWIAKTSAELPVRVCWTLRVNFLVE